MASTEFKDGYDIEERGSGMDTSGNEVSMTNEKPLWYRVLNWGVEEGGIEPAPMEKRTDKRVANLFTVWWSALLCILPIATGMAGPLTYQLSLRDSALVILFFSILSALPPAFMGTLGPKTGMRQMIQARYTFGLYFVTIPLILNAASITGFCVISSIISGQSLSAISSNDSLSINAGIAISSVCALFISFAGYKVLHFYERWFWIPVVIAIIIAVGCGGSKLSLQSEFPPATASSVLTFASLIAGYLIPFGGMVSDFSVYIVPSAPRWKVFTYVFVGMTVPTILLLTLGAAIGGAVPNVPAWNDAYNQNSVGGVLAEMLTPAKGFGKFVVVILALSVISNVALSMYSISLNIQMFHPILTKAPRPLFSIITTAVIIPVSIKAATSFYNSLENFLAIISYWAACFVAIMMTEYVWFRKMDYTTMDREIWNKGRQLPIGLAAIGAGICSFGLIVPCMNEVWYTGPIAKTTGDIGFEVGFFLSILLYVPFRTLEIKLRKGRY